MAATGAFITLEVTEGVGKSTNLAFIEEMLTAAGHEVVVTREPGGTPLGEQIRSWVLGEEDLTLDVPFVTLKKDAPLEMAKHVCNEVTDEKRQGHCNQWSKNYLKHFNR